MSAISRDDARNLIIELRLPAIVLDIFDGRPGPEPLDLWLGAPDTYYMLPPGQESAYAPDRLVPLLDDGNSYAFLAYDRLRHGFVWFDIESRVDPEALKCRSWPEIVATLLVSQWESEYEDDRLREIAALLEFKAIDLVLDACAHDTRHQAQEHERFMESLLAGVRAAHGAG